MGYKKVLGVLGICFILGTGSAYAEKKEVNVLNWSGADSVVIRDDYAKDLNNAFMVYDIETNKSFKMIRTGGTNHADVEPLTKSDTAKYKEIFGGWTWSPRPVVIEVGGILYGASLDAMPHAGYDNVEARISVDKTPGGAGQADYTNTVNYDSVKGNDFDGHTNLHFKGSTTHGGMSTKHPDTIAKMEGLVDGGYDVSGAEKPPSAEPSIPDTNPETTIGDLVTVDDGSFITGKLIGGTKKLPTRTPEEQIDIKDGSPPNGSYYFSYNGVLTGPSKGAGATTKGLATSGNLFNKILQGKERAVVKEMQELQKKKYVTVEISGDLFSSENFWTYDTNKLYENTFASNFKVSDGNKEYLIYIPKGKDAEGNKINQEIIDATISSIGLYKEAVMQGFFGGSVVTSYNLFSMYPVNQLPMTDVIDITKIDKNNVRPLKSTAKMKYTLDYYYHPIFGKLSAEDMPKEKEWIAKFREIKCDLNASGKIGFTLEQSYLDFMDGTDPLRQGAMQMKNAVLNKSNGMRGYDLTHTNDKAEPASLVGTLFRVIVPKHFEQSSINSKYLIKEDTGYQIIEDVRLSITHAMVYVGKEDDLKVAGDYLNYSIDEKGLAFYKTVVDGKIVGAVVPLWYNEAVYDPYEDKLYYTGRPIRFDNDYVGKLEFKRSNVELFTAVEKAGGNRKITIQEFAFGKDRGYLDYDFHENIGNEPEIFDINITFEGHLKGLPDTNHSQEGGADQVEDNKKEDGSDDVANGIPKSVSFSDGRNIITPNYGIPTLMSIAYADEDESTTNIDVVVPEDYLDYYEDTTLPNGYSVDSLSEEGSVSWLSKVNPFSRANKGANGADANKDWGHGVTVSDLKKISKGKYIGKEDIIIKVANIYKVNPALMLSIMMVENGGNSALLNRANNCGSNSWFGACGYPKDDVNGRWIKFPTLDEGINYLGAYLSRVYISQGLRDLESMGKKYCPPTYKDWAKKVGANYKTITGYAWSKSKAGDGIDGIMQIDISEIGTNSTNTSVGGVEDSVTVESTEVFNGFTIIRNNVYLQEPGLLRYLQSNEARALVNTENEELYEKIMGSANMSNDILTYKDWERMQSIRNELSMLDGIDTNLLKLTRLLTMIFGLLLIFYSILLVFAYYIDIFNAMLDVSLLSMMTFGRYYPVANKEDIAMLGSPSDGQKYVNIFQLLVVVTIGVFVGCIFVLATPIMEVIATMYLKIKAIIGGF